MALLRAGAKWFLWDSRLLEENNCIHSFLKVLYLQTNFFLNQLKKLPNECPDLCQHRPGHSLGKNIKLHEMTNGKN